MAGLFFCLDAIQPHTSIYSVFCPVNAIIPTTPQNSARGFTVAFPAIAPVQPPMIPDRHNKPLHRLRHAGGHTRARTRSTYTRYHRHAGTLHSPAQPSIIIRYIRGQTMPAAAGSASPPVNLARVSPAAGGLAPGQQSTRAGRHPGTLHRRDSPAAGSAAGGAESLAALAASLFGLSPDSQ